MPTAMRSGALFLLSVLLIACSGDETGSPAESDTEPEFAPPNILLIVLDDLGYGDLGINSGVAGHTPNLNRFANEGVRFTRNYVDSTCSATRAGILTGTPPPARGFRPGNLGISPEVITLPEALAAVGYSTHHVGKWHLGYASRLAWPHSQGFDSFYGFLNQFLLRGPQQEGSFKLGRPTYHNPWLQRDDGPMRQERGHLTELLLGEVLQFLDSAAERPEPWFLNYWTYLPHTPIQPGEIFASRYPDTPEGRYLAMVAQADDAVGQVLATLEKNGLSDKTLVLVVSDNGGTEKQVRSNHPFEGVKMTFQEGGVRTPLLIRWPDGRWAGRVEDQVVSYLDYFPTLASMAGAATPPDLAGADIASIVGGEDQRSAPLFWDAGDSESHAWSMLSPDGRWRLHRFYNWPPALNDLSANPAGGIDIAQAEPERLDFMHREFLSWRDMHRRVRVDYQRLSQQGAARLTGESLQRAPGFGGYTFAMAVETVQDSTAEEAVQVLALHKGQWSLELADGQLLLDVNGDQVQAQGPVVGACSAIVVAAEHAWNPFHPNQSQAILDIYIDEQLVAHKVVPIRKRPPETYLEPTWIGRGESGENAFRGRLGKPLILNERVRKDDESDPWVGNGVSRISRDLCRGLEDQNIALGHPR